MPLIVTICVIILVYKLIDEAIVNARIKKWDEEHGVDRKRR